MNAYTQEIVAIAERLLEANPADPVHDLIHHQDVLKNALEIARKLDEPVNEDLLTIAVMWHDVTLPDREKGAAASATYTQEEMARHGFSKDEIDEVATAIRYHEYYDSPRTVIGKILFDADKLDILNIGRWQRMSDAEAAGKVSAERAEKSINMVTEWIKELPRKLQLDVSQGLYARDLARLKQEPLAQSYCQRFGINLASL